jgi:hypothetical protein
MIRMLQRAYVRKASGVVAWNDRRVSEPSRVGRRTDGPPLSTNDFQTCPRADKLGASSEREGTDLVREPADGGHDDSGGRQGCGPGWAWCDSAEGVPLRSITFPARRWHRRVCFSQIPLLPPSCLSAATNHRPLRLSAASTAMWFPPLGALSGPTHVLGRMHAIYSDTMHARCAPTSPLLSRLSNVAASSHPAALLP